ncbi:hypothetical protein [Clostridium cibarium]|uniref:Uncharacterized protein n=1 Tax=Clostridium cibarium TaxID=2762247 RepID=A0ABR8PP77_9CLOT|nr:hypothetical protein [Clostridium cibarium]MBD7909978.1 hypothetical protein [Clostridium cibarium]
MNRDSLKRVYEERGLMDYKLETLHDLFYIYGVKLNQIEGYSKLEEIERIRFSRFVLSYYNSSGLDSRDVSFLKVSRENNSLRVEFIDNGEWRVGKLELSVNN